MINITVSDDLQKWDLIFCHQGDVTVSTSLGPSLFSDPIPTAQEASLGAILRGPFGDYSFLPG